MHRCRHELVLPATPRLTPKILATNEQVYHEAKDVLLENEVMVTANSTYQISQPAIHRNQLPNTLEPRLTDLAILVDEIPGTTQNKWFYDVKVLQAATALQKLRIVISAQPKYHDPTVASALVPFMTATLQRIPAICEVVFGAETAVYEKYVADKMACSGAGDAAIDGKVMEGVVKAVEKKGWMSGSKLDYRFVREEDGGDPPSP